MTYAKEGAPVASSDRLDFVLKLVGANVDKGLEKAKEMGLTGDDLEFLEQEDIKTLLTASLQRRKFTAVCKYLKNGGTLCYGMTMADVYGGQKPAASATENVTSTKPQTEPSQSNNASLDADQQKRQSNNDWMSVASNAMNSMSGKMRQFQTLQNQFGSITSQFTKCLSG